MPSLTWILREGGIREDVQGRWADFRFLIRPPVGLENRILMALDLYPCDLLFVHRDAENVIHARRKREIDNALAELEQVRAIATPTICVVPVRMQEAWLLLDEAAIRRAAGNPTGRVSLELPRPNRVESVVDPKALLFTALRIASEQTGRRLAKLHFPSLRYRVAELVVDYSPLRALSAFRSLEYSVLETLGH
jgi:hypothetical protein